MVIATMYELMVEIVGVPADDIQKTLLYMGAICISVIIFFMIIWIFKVISGIIQPKGL